MVLVDIAMIGMSMCITTITSIIIIRIIIIIHSIRIIIIVGFLMIAIVIITVVTVTVIVIIVAIAMVLGVVYVVIVVVAIVESTLASHTRSTADHSRSASSTCIIDIISSIRISSTGTGTVVITSSRVLSRGHTQQVSESGSGGTAAVD